MLLIKLNICIEQMPENALAKRVSIYLQRLASFCNCVNGPLAQEIRMNTDFLQHSDGSQD